MPGGVQSSWHKHYNIVWVKIRFMFQHAGPYPQKTANSIGNELLYSNGASVYRFRARIEYGGYGIFTTMALDIQALKVHRVVPKAMISAI